LLWKGTVARALEALETIVAASAVERRAKRKSRYIERRVSGAPR
jgi:hypothetical protein